MVEDVETEAGDEAVVAEAAAVEARGEEIFVFSLRKQDSVGMEMNVDLVTI